MRPDWPPGLDRIRRAGCWLGHLLKEGLVGLAVSTWLLGTALPARAAPTGQVGVSVYILNPPNAVTDLAAAAVGSSDGDVQLTWTAPANLNGAALTLYNIRFATFAAANVGQAESWWVQATPSNVVVSPAHTPGTFEFTTLNGLTLGVTYYFGIKSTDVDAQISAIDTRVGTVNQAKTLPLNTNPGGPPPAPTNLNGIALSTRSVQWSWTAATGASFYTLNQHPSGTMVDQTTSTVIIESSRTPNVPLTRTIRAGNGSGLSAPTTAVTVYTLAAPPNSPSFGNVQYSNVTVFWSSGGNPAGTQYRLERSEDNLSFTPATLTTSLSYQDSGLTAETTYYYRIRALNGDGVQTAPSISISTVTLLQVDVTPPNFVLGLKGILDPTGIAFTLIWEDVNLNADGTPITDLAGYHVYRRTSIGGTATRITPTPLSTPAFADVVNNQIYYYTIRAIDTSGNLSEDSLIADSSRDANVIFVGTDSISSVIMPDSINQLLRSENNKYGVPLYLRLTEEGIPANTNILRQIRLQFIRGDNFQALNDVAFKLPQAIVTIGYNVINGAPAPGVPVAGQLVGARAAGDKPSLFWNNGVTWVKIGGTIDENKNTLAIKSSYLGLYQVRSSALATSLTLEQANVFPRLFTPNGDGYNDRVYFILENPNNAEVSGQISDLSGRYVARVQTLNTIGTTLFWDGKDSNGATVPSGAYLYKVQGEGKTFTGTVGVAR